MKMFIKVYHGDFKTPGRKLFQNYIAKKYPDSIVVLAHYDNNSVTISCFHGTNSIDCDPNNNSINNLGAVVDELKQAYTIPGENVIAYIEANLRNKCSAKADKLTAEAVACLNALKPGVVVFFMGTPQCEKHTSFCITHNGYNLQELNFKNRSIDGWDARDFIAEDNTLTVTCEAPSYFFVLNKEQVIPSIVEVLERISTIPDYSIAKTPDVTPEQSVANELSAIGSKSGNQGSLGYDKPTSIYEGPVGSELFQGPLVRPTPLELSIEKAVSPKPQPRSGYSFGLFHCCSSACSDVVPFATTPLHSSSVAYTS